MTCGYSYGASFFETVESTISNTTELIAVPRPRPVIRVYSFECKPRDEKHSFQTTGAIRSGSVVAPHAPVVVRESVGVGQLRSSRDLTVGATSGFEPARRGGRIRIRPRAGRAALAREPGSLLGPELLEPRPFAGFHGNRGLWRPFRTMRDSYAAHDIHIQVTSTRAARREHHAVARRAVLGFSSPSRLIASPVACTDNVALVPRSLSLV